MIRRGFLKGGTRKYIEREKHQSWMNKVFLAINSVFPTRNRIYFKEKPRFFYGVYRKKDLAFLMIKDRNSLLRFDLLFQKLEFS